MYLIEMFLKQFDIVQIITTKRIKYLSAPKGRPASPNGNWSVVAIIADTDNIMIAKENTLIIIPSEDIRQVASYDPQVFKNRLKNTGLPWHKKIIDVIEEISKYYNISKDDVEKVLKDYNFPKNVETKKELEDLISKLPAKEKEKWQQNK